MGPEEVGCLMPGPRSFTFAFDSLAQRWPGGPRAYGVQHVVVTGLGFAAPENADVVSKMFAIDAVGQIEYAGVRLVGVGQQNLPRVGVPQPVCSRTRG